MPHPGTHISALQMLAAETPPGARSLADALGGISAEPLADGDEEVRRVLRHRYACLGALGPDLLYFMLDTDAPTQTAQDLIVKFFATFRAFEQVSDTLSEDWEKALATGSKVDFCNILGLVDAVGGELKGTLDLGMGIISDAIEGLVTGGLGLNLFAILTAPRQENKEPDKWWWADHLHYAHTGVFTTTLLNLAFRDPAYRDRPELRAYALGYLTHVIGDVVGHPYVNQIVGGPYRLHRQRHTLVENFIDGFVWQHTHRPVEPSDAIDGDKNPRTGRKWLHTVRGSATDCFTPSEADYYRSRIDTLIDVGSAGGFSDAIESALSDMADGFQAGSNAVFGTAGVKVGDDALWSLWADMFLQAMRMTYASDTRHPRNINPDQDGFPTKADIGAGYATCLAILRMQTKSTIEKPEFPDISGFDDVTRKWVGDIVEGLADAAGDLLPHLGGTFSLSSLLDWAKKVLRAARKIVDTVINALRELCTAGTDLVIGIVKVAFYLIKMPLWAAYNALHRVLELRAYAQPLPDTIDGHTSLWVARTNAQRAFAYPVMEPRSGARPAASKDLVETRIMQDQLFTALEPLDDPAVTNGPNLEHPFVLQIGQDFAGGAVTNRMPATPLDLLFAARVEGVTGMFGRDGPVPLGALAVDAAGAITGPERKYGGIVPNCRFAVEAVLRQAERNETTVVPPDLFLHDYNLDGDRGLGWLSWDLVVGSGPLRPATDVDTAVLAEKWRTPA